MLYIKLFYTFFKIGLFGFGGGYGMLSLIQIEIVDRNQWLTIDKFADIIAVSQATPGPIGINSATYVGYSTAGFWGAAVASFAVVLPSLFLMLILIKIFSKYHHNFYVKTALGALKIVVIGLIASAAVMLINTETFGESYSDFASWAMLLSTVVAIKFFKISPILMIGVGGIFGYFYYG